MARDPWLDDDYAMTDTVAEAPPLPEYGAAPEVMGLPEYEPPALLAQDRMGFADRLALALATMPGYGGPRAYETPMSAGVRGAASGLARGFSAARQSKTAERRGEVDAINKARQDAAERQYRLAMQSRLRRTPAEPKAPVVKPTPEEQGKADAARVAERNAGLRQRGEPVPGEGRGRTAGGGREKAGPESKPLRWTPTGSQAIRLAESQRERAISEGADDETVQRARARVDELKKADFATQMRTAKSRREAEALAMKALAQFPEWAGSPMIQKLAADKLAEFGR